MAEFWQHFAADGAVEDSLPDAYAARMPDGRLLALPLRDLGDRAVAGLIVSQASFAVLDRLTGWVADGARHHAADIVVGLPTLGHAVAAGVARALGHANWAAAGFSRKFWYDPALSVPVASVTSPDAGRLMWLDPNLLPRLRGRRVLLVDDVISTGRSMRAGLALLQLAGITPVAAAVAMIQGDAWQEEWPRSVPLSGAFATPLFRPAASGWVAQPGTALQALCR